MVVVVVVRNNDGKTRKPTTPPPPPTPFPPSHVTPGIVDRRARTHVGGGRRRVEQLASVRFRRVGRVGCVVGRHEDDVARGHAVRPQRVVRVGGVGLVAVVAVAGGAGDDDGPEGVCKEGGGWGSGGRKRRPPPLSPPFPSPHPCPRAVGSVSAACRAGPCPRQPPHSRTVVNRLAGGGGRQSDRGQRGQQGQAARCEVHVCACVCVAAALYECSVGAERVFVRKKN